MNSISLFKKAKLALTVFQPRFCTLSCHWQNNPFLVHAGRKSIKLYPRNASYKSVKYISNCNLMQTKDSDSAANKSEDKFHKALEDKEFRSILQDFSKDFGVDNDSNKLLEDIRQNIDGGTGDDQFSEKHSTSSDVSVSTVDRTFQFKYKEFLDSDSSVIHSYEDEYDPFEGSEETYHVDQELKPKSLYHDLKRGITGVFDLNELIDVLRNESLLDVTSISIPQELHYADYLVLVTAKSERHSEAVAELIRKLYKQKKTEADPFVKIEGEKVSDWKVIDMGNIVLHIFLDEARALYDLESLWLLDSKFDSGGNMQADPMLIILEEQMKFFDSLQQSSESPKDIS